MKLFRAKLEIVLPQLAGEDYEIAYIDPAWLYYGDPKKNAAAGKHFGCMAFEDVASLPVREILARRAALFCWMTSPLMHRQMTTVARWGLHFRGISHVWVKTRKDGGLIHGQGIRPTLTKPTAEFLTVWTTNARGRVFPLLTEKQPQVVLHPRTERHGGKPNVFRDLIVELLGDRKRIELWARDCHDGWDAVGDELEV